MVRRDTFVQANLRGKKLQATIPRILHARYDRESGRIVIHLSSKIDIMFLPHDAQGLDAAKPSQLDTIEITPSGLGLYFPKLDADIYLPGLLEGFLGSRSWMATRMGSAGGKAKSIAKSSAARANGKLGGRPKKVMAS